MVVVLEVRNPTHGCLIIVASNNHRIRAYRRPLPSTSTVNDARSQSRSPLSICSLSLPRSLPVSARSAVVACLLTPSDAAGTVAVAGRPPFPLSFPQPLFLSPGVAHVAGQQKGPLVAFAVKEKEGLSPLFGFSFFFCYLPIQLILVV